MEYATREQAQQAVNTLSNQNLMGRLVYVREVSYPRCRITRWRLQRGSELVPLTLPTDRIVKPNLASLDHPPVVERTKPPLLVVDLVVDMEEHPLQAVDVKSL